MTGHIEVKNRTPIISLFNLARADYSTSKDNTISVAFNAEASNYLSSTIKDDEAFYIDGESYFYEYKTSYRRNSNIFSLTVPYIVHTNGFLDRLIYDFHDVLGLPQNGRTDFQHDEQRWQLVSNGETLVNFDNSQKGLGDITLSYGRLLTENEQIFLALKLPTGDFDKQTGSESWDLGLSYAQINPHWLGERSWLQAQSLSVWWGGSVNYLNKADDLSPLDAEQLVITGRVGLGWSPIKDWSIKAQFDANSPLFDSDIRELGWAPIQASFSSAHMFAQGQYKLEFMIAEDLRPRTTPDVVFGLLFQTEFQLHP